MIYLTTGGNGAGKTLFTLADVRAQQLRENRPVYFHGFTPKQVLLDWGWKSFEPADWQDLPDGSICIFDECQNEMPAKIDGKLPDWINAIAQFRRKRGFDFWLITPHPSMIHLNVRRLIESPSWHRHMKRTFGSDMVSEIRFNFAEMKCEQPNAGARGQVSMRAFPKEVYDWYVSASLHTGKKRIPKQVWVLLACAVLVPTAGYFGYKTLVGNVTKHAAPGDVSAAGGVAGPAARPVDVVGDYIAEYRPRIEGLPNTAPRFDEVTKPVVAPYPAACLESKKGCECFTQQATRLQVPADLCHQIVQGGFFIDWDTTRGGMAAANPSPSLAPSPVPAALAASPVPSPVPVVLAPSLPHKKPLAVDAGPRDVTAPPVAESPTSAHDGAVIGALRSGRSS